MDNYNKMWSLIRNTDLLNRDEKNELHLYLIDLKKQKEIIDRIKKLIKQYGKYDGQNCTRGFQMWTADFNKLLEILEDKEVIDNIKYYLEENEQLKLINKEYERLDNGNIRGFTITSVKQYNIDELVKCEENWKKLKEFLETNWKEAQDIWFVKIINKMKELERGSDSNE